MRRRSRLPRSTPEIEAVSRQIAITSRIVVQPLLPPGLWPEAELRFYLTARGELENFRDAQLNARDDQGVP